MHQHEFDYSAFGRPSNDSESIERLSSCRTGLLLASILHRASVGRRGRRFANTHASAPTAAG
jgi:hypothetical protein